MRQQKLFKNLKPLKKRERPFENRLRDALKEVGVLFIKMKPTVVGWPDRLVMGHQSMRLVELKAEDEEPEEAQVLRHEEIYTLSGKTVLVIRGPDVKAAVKNIVWALKQDP